MIWLFVLLSLPFVTILLIRYTVHSRANKPYERTVIVEQGCLFGLVFGAFFMILSLFGNVIHLPTALESVVDRVLLPCSSRCGYARAFSKPCWPPVQKTEEADLTSDQRVDEVLRRQGAK